MPEDDDTAAGRRAAIALCSAIALALSISAACLGTHQIAPPPDAGARSIVVVFFRGADPFVVAADVAGTLEASLPPFSSAPGGGSARILVLEYGCSLAAVGLTPGEQPLTETRQTALPPPIAMFEHAATSGGAGWMRQDRLTPEILALLGRIRPAVSRTCPEAKRVQVSGDIAFGIGLADGSVFVGTKRRLFYRVSLGEGARQLAIHAYQYLAAHRAGDRLYLVGEYGEILTTTIDGPVTGISGMSFDKTPRLWLTGAEIESPHFELFRLHDKGSFERLPAGEMTWMPAGEPTGPRVQRLVNAGVEWIGPGDAVSVGGLHLTRTGGPRGGLVISRTPAEADFTAVAKTPELGVIVGDEDGLVFRLDDRLTPIPGAAVGDTITALAPLGKGFVIVRRGRVDFFEGALRPCFARPILANDALHAMPSTSVAALIDEASVIFLTMPDEAATRSCSMPAR